MSDKKHFSFKHHTRAGEVTGTVTVYVEGPADGIAVAVERIVPHVMALPVDEVEALEELKPKLTVADARRQRVAEAEATWESEALRMADESGIDGDEDEGDDDRA